MAARKNKQRRFSALLFCCDQLVFFAQTIFLDEEKRGREVYPCEEAEEEWQTSCAAQCAVRGLV